MSKAPAHATVRLTRNPSRTSEIGPGQQGRARGVGPCEVDEDRRRDDGDHRQGLTAPQQQRQRGADAAHEGQHVGAALGTGRVDVGGAHHDHEHERGDGHELERTRASRELRAIHHTRDSMNRRVAVTSVRC